MRPEPVRVAIDLETTGLRPEQDAIIEIGAVKFAGTKIIDTFQSFVSITAPLPFRIHRLTGITAADLRKAPPLAVLTAPLRAFIGAAPLVGHSVSFDAAFLRRAGLAQRNPLIDTYELASMLLPDLASYTLGSVADALKVPSSIHHRALADADLSRAVFLALLERLSALDTAAIGELAALPAASGWSPAYLLKSEARAREEAIKSSPFASLLTAAPAGRSVDAGMSPALLTMAVALEERPEARAQATAPAVSEAAPADGVSDVSDAMPPREPWVSLGAFMREGGALLLELERTEGALIRALAEVARGATAGQRIIIAASDSEEMKRVAQALLPEAIAHAGLDAAQVQVAELDEREGYLCLHRWFGVAREDLGRPLSPELTRGLAKLTVWARETSTGRRADVALSGAEAESWARVRAGREFAESAADCPYRAGGYCFAERAAQRASAAQIVVTTHTALAAQLAQRDTWLPDAARVILLDGRQIEDELRRQQTFTLDAASLFSLLDSLASTAVDGSRSGLLPLASTLAPGIEQHAAEAWYVAADHAREAVAATFAALRAVLQEGQERNARGGSQREAGASDNGMLRVDGGVRASRTWPALLQAWASLSAALARVAGDARAAAQALTASSARLSPREGGIRADLLGLAQRIDEVSARGSELLAGAPHDNIVSWLRAPQPQGDFARERRSGARTGNGNGSSVSVVADGASEVLLPAGEREESERRESHDAIIAEAPTIIGAPIQVGALLAPLWAEGYGVAALGWALSVGGDFEYTRVALGLPETTRMLATTPDYSRQTLLCLPTDAPEPAAQSYHSQFEALIVSLARALEGDVVAIFPSHAALRNAAMGITRTLERHDILVLAQGIDGSARQLWHAFDNQPRTVLLGAGAFWDGAEQRHRAPACIVVARTPFPPQSDPLVAARADLWADQQAQFMTPQAALKLRQALGGLAWSHTRRNAVVLYDKRLQTRGYGPTILGALPQCELYQSPAATLAERIAEWTREQPVS